MWLGTYRNEPSKASEPSNRCGSLWSTSYLLYKSWDPTTPAEEDIEDSSAIKPNLLEEEESVGGNETVDREEEPGEEPIEDGDPNEEPLEEEDPEEDPIEGEDPEEEPLEEEDPEEKPLVEEDPEKG